MSGKPRVPIRAPRGAEIHMDVEKMHALFDGAGASLDYGTKTERLIMAGDLAKVAMRAAKAGTPLSVFSWEYGTDALQTALTERLQRFVQHGRRQVADELQRQRDAAAGTSAKLAEPLRLAAKRRQPKRVPGPGTTEAAAVTAVGISAGVAAAMRGSAGTAIVAKAGPPATAADLETVIMAAGDDALLRLAASVHDLVSLGRAEEAKARQDEIEDAVYSALLDGNTCDECEAMDGQTTTDLAEAEGWTPWPDCAGGSRCRCVTVYQLRQ
jgi:hypothetical protein